MKKIKWRGEEISYHEDNLIPLIARAVHITESSTVRFIIESIEKSFAGEKLLYDDWNKLKERLRVYL